MRVAVGTCRPLTPPYPDLDEPLLFAALAARGIEAKSFAWEDGAAPFLAWSDLVVIRSTWNYAHHAEAFLSWVDEVGAKGRLLNPPNVIRWNSHKTYLRELDVPVVPTVYVDRGGHLALADLGWQDVVVKPTVSLGSFRTARFRGDLPAAQAFLDALAADRDAMVQPYMPAVETYGERSLIWIDGALSHAVRKNAQYGSVSGEMPTAVPIADDERAFADRVLARFAKDLLYARVDTIRDGEQIRLMELELIEPFLFCISHPPAADALAAAIARRL